MKNNLKNAQAPYGFMCPAHACGPRTERFTPHPLASNTVHRKARRIRLYRKHSVGAVDLHGHLAQYDSLMTGKFDGQVLVVDTSRAIVEGGEPRNVTVH